MPGFAFKLTVFLVGIVLLTASTGLGQTAYARMPAARQPLYTPQPLPVDFQASAIATMPAGKITRLSPGWLDQVRQTNKGQLLIYVAVFDCQYGVQELVKLDSLARQHPALKLMLVSVDDWSLLGGIQDLYRTHHLERPIFTLDMLAYDNKRQPGSRLQQVSTEASGQPTKRKGPLKFLLLQDDQIVYTGPASATLKQLQSQLP